LHRIASHRRCERGSLLALRVRFALQEAAGYVKDTLTGAAGSAEEKAGDAPAQATKESLGGAAESAKDTAAKATGQREM
jgi:hypothetical protein